MTFVDNYCVDICIDLMQFPPPPYYPLPHIPNAHITCISQYIIFVDKNLDFYFSLAPANEH